MKTSHTHIIEHSFVRDICRTSHTNIIEHSFVRDIFRMSHTHIIEHKLQVMLINKLSSPWEFVKFIIEHSFVLDIFRTSHTPTLNTSRDYSKCLTTCHRSSLTVSVGDGPSRSFTIRQHFTPYPQHK